MNVLTKLNGLAAGMKLIPLLAMMNQHSKKANKTREEEEVLISFKKSMASAVFVTLIGIAIICIPLLDMALSIPEGNTRYGTVVEDDKVRYVKNTLQYTTLSELNISPSQVNEGDRIIMWFDHQDDLITKAIPKSIYNENLDKKGIYFIITFIISITGIVTSSVVIRKTIGKKYYEYYIIQMEGRGKSMTNS